MDFSGVSRSDWKEWECDPLLAPDVLHNGERKSVYKVFRRSPRFYLKQVICELRLSLRKHFKTFIQGTGAPLTPKDQPRGNICDCGKHTRSEKTLPDGGGHRREESQAGGHHGGGELRADGLRPHFSRLDNNGDEEKWGDGREGWYASCSKTE